MVAIGIAERFLQGFRRLYFRHSDPLWRDSWLSLSRYR
jgi:hypothetical protein